MRQRWRGGRLLAARTGAAAKRRAGSASKRTLRDVAKRQNDQEATRSDTRRHAEQYRKRENSEIYNKCKSTRLSSENLTPLLYIYIYIYTHTCITIRTSFWNPKCINIGPIPKKTAIGPRKQKHRYSTGPTTWYKPSGCNNSCFIFVGLLLVILLLLF